MLKKGNVSVNFKLVVLDGKPLKDPTLIWF